MAVTAIVVEGVERDTINAKQAARIPPVCKILPTAIESREKIPRFVVAEGSTDFPFKPSFVRRIVWMGSLLSFCRSILVDVTKLRFRRRRRSKLGKITQPQHVFNTADFFLCVCKAIFAEHLVFDVFKLIGDFI